MRQNIIDKSGDFLFLIGKTFVVKQGLSLLLSEIEDVMDRRTVNASFVHAPMYVGFILVYSFNVDHPLYIFGELCQKQHIHDT